MLTFVLADIVLQIVSADADVLRADEDVELIIVSSLTCLIDVLLSALAQRRAEECLSSAFICVRSIIEADHVHRREL